MVDRPYVLYHTFFKLISNMFFDVHSGATGKTAEYRSTLPTQLLSPLYFSTQSDIISRTTIKASCGSLEIHVSASSPVVRLRTSPCEWVEGPSRQCFGRLRVSCASWGWVSLPLLRVDGKIRPSLTARHRGPDCYTGTVWRWAMALQFISRCSSPTRAPSAHFSSVGALRKMDWLAGPSEEAKRVAKSLCSTWLLSYASLMKDIHKLSLGSFFCIRCLRVACTLEMANV